MNATRGRTSPEPATGAKRAVSTAARRLSRWLSLADACDPAIVARLAVDRPGDLDDAPFALAAAVCAAYPALRHFAWIRPDIFATLARDGVRAERRRAEFLRRLRAAIDQQGGVRRGLRRGSDVERVRIAARELEGFSSGAPDVDVTAREWSELAEAQIELALEEARAHVERRFGPVCLDATASNRAEKNGFVVLGFGKLGGGELNAGSDIDLMFLYESDDGFAAHHGPDDPDATTPIDAFSRIAQRLVATLDEHDDDGFCARVDLRLRPDGAAGALVVSVASALAYYESYGRPWERAALLRARPVAGDLALGERFLAEVSPFVFRKTVDPSIAREMREMLERGRAEISSDPSRDLKLGAGGIREAEFFVQTLQLIWGGRDPRVRSTNTLDGLRRLRTRGYVTDREARDLESAYLLLRRVEHRVQLATGLQTHLIPESSVERERLARSLGLRAWTELSTQLDRARNRVDARFDSLAPATVHREDDALVEALLRTLEAPNAIVPTQTPLAVPALDRTPRPAAAQRGPGHLTPARDALREADVGAGQEGAPRLVQHSASVPLPPVAPPLADSSAISPDFLASLRALARRPDALLGARTVARHPRFVRRLVRMLLDAADPDRASTLVRAFFERLAPPSVESYVRMLDEDERALARLVGLCGASEYLGGSLVGHPELAERLLFGARTGVVDEHRAEAVLAEELDALARTAPIEGATSPDAESFAGALRRAKGALELEVGLAELAGEISTSDVGRALGGMADATLTAATRWATRELLAKRGVASSAADDAQPRLEGLAILALGKLGARELGFGSDLDVVFVYDPESLERAGLGAVVDREDAPEFFGRIAARVIRLIGTPHGDGPGYELDARLRPSGEQGHLVASLEAFRTYHLGARRTAASWERQALTRLRACAGDREIGRQAEAIAREAAYASTAPDARELLQMRARIEVEIARERAGFYDVKLGRGGAADVEFAVQFLQLLHGHDHEAVRETQTLRALEALEAIGAIAPAHATTLREGYHFLRRLEQRARIVHGGKTARIGEAAPGLQALARALGHRDRGDASAGEQLVARYRDLSEDVRAAFLAVMGGDEG